jgi:hypothetical protein
VVPIAAAIGGMVLPAGIYLAVTAGSDALHGWGIPMATDIAFAVGILRLAGGRAPRSLGVTLEVRGRVKEVKGRKVVVEALLRADGAVCARGEVVAVQVPEHLFPSAAAVAPTER